MAKRLAGVLVCIFILSVCTAVFAAEPASGINFKTVWKTDDFFLALDTDSVILTTQQNGDLVLSVTAKWSYAKPDRVARYYPAAGKQAFAWRISSLAVQYDKPTGFIKVMELDTVLYDARGQAVLAFRNPYAPWRILSPTDPDFESVDRILNYLRENPK